MKGRLLFGRNPPNDNVKTYESEDAIPPCPTVDDSQYVFVKNWWIKWPVLWQRSYQGGLSFRCQVCDFRVIAIYSKHMVGLILLRLLTRKRILGWTHGITKTPRVCPVC